MSTGLVVQALARPEWLVEIDGTAVISRMTFSLVARCANTGMFGLAISSSSPRSCGALRLRARRRGRRGPRKNVTDPRHWGPLALDLMQSGMSAAEAIEGVRAKGKFIEYRQVLAVDKTGATAIHSGPNSLGIWTQAQGPDVASGGNMLANDGVPQAIVDGFRASSGHLGDRLIAAIARGSGRGW